MSDWEERIVALVPARAGSKGVPNKNLLLLGGRPLVSISVAAAVKSEAFSDVFISSDSMAIVDAATSAGATFTKLRNPELAKDDSGIVEVAIDFLQSEFSGTDMPDWLALLEPTSPLRKQQDLGKMASMVRNQFESDALVTFSQARQHPGFFHVVDEKGYVSRVTGNMIGNRQNQPKYLYPCGVAYFVRVEALMREETFYPQKTQAYLVPSVQSFEIDEPVDVAILNKLSEDADFSWLF